MNCILTTTSMILTLTLLCAAATSGAEPVYTLTPDDHGMTLKTPDGRTVFSYMTKKPQPTNLTANSVCCLYPVFTPSGVRAVDFAPGDHRHHRGIFLAWHSMAGGNDRADFWGWGSFAPTENRVIRNRQLQLVAADADHAHLEAHNDWQVGEKTIVKENLNITARELEGAFVIDLAFHLQPQVDMTLDSTAFGGFCVKGRKEGEAVYTNPQGKVTLPNPHHLHPTTDWPEADWYDYTIELEEGATVGVAVLDHPDNPASLWHNLKPIAMVNPCIVALNPVSRKKGDSLVLRYRVVVHDGSPSANVLNQLADQFAR
jgi:hypothetical protein